MPRTASFRSLAELAGLFLRLGTIGFGGPAAHVAMMEDEIVRRRQWLTREQFLDYLGATNLIPGPNSTELAIHIGRLRAGWPGFLVSGAAFILPAAVVAGALAWVYVRFGAFPEVAGFLYGVKPVVIAIVLQALWGLGRSALKSRALAGLGLAAGAAAALGLHELVVLGAAGLVAGAFSRIGRAHESAAVVGSGDSGAWLITLAAGSAAGTGSGAASLGSLFFVFVKIGSVLFGSGYVLLAFLRADLVTRLGWMSERQLLDAVAVGQLTPGPLSTTATFIGYQLAGWPGAAVATVGIFLPAFVFVALSGPLVPRIRGSRFAGAALDGVNVASLALMAVVTWQLARAAVVDGATLLLAALSAMLLARFRIHSAWLVGGGALCGWILGR